MTQTHTKLSGLWKGIIPFLVLVAAFFAAPAAHAAWYNTSYQYCRQLTMTAGGGSGGAATTTTNGFALVATSTIASLATVANGGHVQNTNTSSGTTTPTDVAITGGTDCNNATSLLDFYFEKYDATTGQFVVWVEPKDVSSTSPKSVLMYYGNSGASDVSSETGVYGALGEAAVYNLSENPAGSSPQMKDSTSNANNGTTFGSMPASASVLGMADGALNFNGSQYVSAPNASSLNPTTAMAASGWLFVTNPLGGDHPRLLQKGDGDNEYRLLFEGTLKFNVVTTIGNTSANVTYPTTGFWHLITGTYDGTNVRLYVDGVLGDTQGLTGTITAQTDALFLATKNAGAPTGDHLNGMLDDVSLYNKNLTAMDVLTIYNNTRSSTIFWTFGAEQNVPATTVTGPRLNIFGKLTVNGLVI